MDENFYEIYGNSPRGYATKASWIGSVPSGDGFMHLVEEGKLARVGQEKVPYRLVDTSLHIDHGINTADFTGSC